MPNAKDVIAAAKIIGAKNKMTGTKIATDVFTRDILRDALQKTLPSG